jgi:hypothetical protein
MPFSWASSPSGRRVASMRASRFAGASSSCGQFRRAIHGRRATTSRTHPAPPQARGKRASGRGGDLQHGISPYKCPAQGPNRTLSHLRSSTEPRIFVADRSKARLLPLDQLERIEDEHARMSLRLQEAFGLRREEAIKFQPAYADQGNQLRLRPSWCKGGRAREIPTRTPEQRQLLRECHQLAGTGSLIPPERTYIEQRRVYERHAARAGLSKLHGLRHAYAQARYQELTGSSAPACGGPDSRQLTPQQRKADRRARLQISRELEQITAVYLGR